MTLVGLAGCTPERVGEDLARALAALVHRALRHTAGADGRCVACLTAGQRLAVPVGRALFAVRRPTGRELLTPADYQAVGAAIELLEEAAGSRR